MQSNIPISVHSFIRVFILSSWKSRFFRYNLLMVRNTFRYSFWFFLCIPLGDRLSKYANITLAYITICLNINIFTFILKSYSLFVTFFWAVVMVHLFFFKCSLYIFIFLLLVPGVEFWDSCTPIFITNFTFSKSFLSYFSIDKNCRYKTI